VPIYEYQCAKCGERTEAIQRLEDPPLARCGRCGGKLRKLLSAPAFQFKGSGWYVTDYAGRKGGEESAKPAESADSAPSADAPSDAAAKAGDGASSAKTEGKTGAAPKKAAKGSGAAASKTNPAA
jgi:putative FmdB family regulatory protein